MSQGEAMIIPLPNTRLLSLEEFCASGSQISPAVDSNGGPTFKIDDSDVARNSRVDAFVVCVVGLDVASLEFTKLVDNYKECARNDTPHSGGAVRAVTLIDEFLVDNRIALKLVDFDAPSSFN